MTFVCRFGAGRSKYGNAAWPVHRGWTLLLHLSCWALAGLILPFQMQAQTQQMDKPFKVNIRLLNAPPEIDDRVSIEVSLLNSANARVPWNRPCNIQVEVTAPSGKKEKYVVSIQAGQSATQLTFYVREPGLFLLRAQETSNSLLPAGNSVLVRPRRSKTGERPAIPGFAPARLLNVVYHGELFQPKLVRAATHVEGQAAQLLFINSTGREILADGKDFARLQVHFIDPTGKPAPSDIRIWLSWSNGELSAQPLVIKKGESSSEARFTSSSAGEAVVTLVNSAPKYFVDGQREVKVSVVPPIYAIKSSSPDPLVLSLIDCQPLLAQFFDEQGRTVQTGKPRRITFSSSTSVLRLVPSSREVKADEAGASVLILPTWSGRSTLKIFTPGYEPQTVTVEVTMWSILLLCLGGGIVGGVAARGKLKESFLWRSFAGVVGAVVLVWFCVYAVLPQTRSLVAHNHISAFVVSVIGGYGGTRALHFVMNKIGIPLDMPLDNET
jgi:hypothetical protein